MRVKLDENLGGTIEAAFREAGHDVETVVSQGMAGADDRRLITHCRDEGRCLVTLDKEFGEPLLFPPEQFAGIILLRLPARSGRPELEAAAAAAVRGLDRLEAEQELHGKLWIAQPGRLREYRPVHDDDED